MRRSYRHEGAQDLSGEPSVKERVKVLVLGSGWGAIPFLKYLDPKVAHCNYDVTMVSPRNYFLYSPLLPGGPCPLRPSCHHVISCTSPH